MIMKADLPIFSAEGVTGVIDGKLYVLPGACDGNRYPLPGSCAEEPTRRFYRYDPATNTWATRHHAPHLHRDGAAAVIDGKFYVAGGIDGSHGPVASLDVYDPTTNSWRTLASIPTGGGPAQGAALQGQFYIVVQSFAGASATNRTYAYNRATNQWKTRAAPSFVGPVTRVALDGRSYLFMASGDHSALYTP
jgi:N-acetylneuraminic acid mutarotase